MSASEALSPNVAVLTCKLEKRNQEDGDSVIGAGPKTKGRETVSHFSCARSPFPPGRKHGDSFQCHTDLRFGLQIADIGIKNVYLYQRNFIRESTYSSRLTPLDFLLFTKMIFQQVIFNLKLQNIQGFVMVHYYRCNCKNNNEKNMKQVEYLRKCISSTLC